MSALLQNLRNPAALICPSCSYDMRGQPTAVLMRCPECGAVHSHARLSHPNMLKTAPWSHRVIVTVVYFFGLAAALAVVGSLPSKPCGRGSGPTRPGIVLTNPVKAGSPAASPPPRPQMAPQPEK